MHIAHVTMSSTSILDHVVHIFPLDSFNNMKRRRFQMEHSLSLRSYFVYKWCDKLFDAIETSPFPIDLFKGNDKFPKKVERERENERGLQMDPFIRLIWFLRMISQEKCCLHTFLLL